MGKHRSQLSPAGGVQGKDSSWKVPISLLILGKVELELIPGAEIQSISEAGAELILTVALDVSEVYRAI